VWTAIVARRSFYVKRVGPNDVLAKIRLTGNSARNVTATWGPNDVLAKIRLTGNSARNVTATWARASDFRWWVDRCI
jgi:hypothetical protein